MQQYLSMALKQLIAGSVSVHEEVEDSGFVDHDQNQRKVSTMLKSVKPPTQEEKEAMALNKLRMDFRTNLMTRNRLAAMANDSIDIQKEIEIKKSAKGASNRGGTLITGLGVTKLNHLLECGLIYLEDLRQAVDLYIKRKGEYDDPTNQDDSQKYSILDYIAIRCSDDLEKFYSQLLIKMYQNKGLNGNKQTDAAFWPRLIKWRNHYAQIRQDKANSLKTFVLSM
jgi:hypothetical protein